MFTAQVLIILLVCLQVFSLSPNVESQGLNIYKSTRDLSGFENNMIQNENEDESKHLLKKRSDDPILNDEESSSIQLSNPISALQNILNQGQNLIDSMPSLLAMLRVGLSWLLKGLQGTIAVLGSTISAIVDILTGFLYLIYVGYILNPVLKLVENIVLILLRLIGGYSNVPDFLIDIGNSFINDVSSFVTKFLSVLISIPSKMFNSVISMISNIPSLVVGGIRSLIGSLGSLIGNPLNPFSSIASILGSLIRNPLNIFSSITSNLGSIISNPLSIFPLNIH